MITKVMSTPTQSRTNPALAAPTMRIVFCVALISATALVTKCRGTDAATSGCRAGWSKAMKKPLANENA